MMEAGKLRVGIVACNGVDCLGGIIARLAAGKVISQLCPEQTIGQCLPLFLTGNMKEQEFSRTYPTITIEGCRQACACSVVEKYSGKVIISTTVPAVAGDEVAALPPVAEAAVGRTYAEQVDAVSHDVAAKVNELLARLAHMAGGKAKHTCGGCSGDSNRSCECSSCGECG